MPFYKRYRHNGQYLQNTITTWPNQYIGSGHSLGIFGAPETAQHYSNLCVEFPDQFDPKVTDASEQLRLICEHETRQNDASHKQDFAVAFGIPAEEITVEYSEWDGRDGTLPFASDNSAPVQRIPEERREGYVKPEPQPPTADEKIAALETRLDAVAAYAGVPVEVIAPAPKA